MRPMGVALDGSGYPLGLTGDQLLLESKILAVSDIDKTTIAQTFRVPAEKIVVVPNGADVGKLNGYPAAPGAVQETLGLQAGEKIVLFFGSLNHGANAQAADLILDEIAGRLASARPQSDWRIVIAGLGRERYLSKRQGPIGDRVLFSGYVDEIAPMIKSAHVIIVPIISGSGTRFKIIEGAACGKRVISTAIGAEGLKREVFGEALLIRDEWDAFALAIDWGLDQPPDLALPEAFIDEYDWEHILERADLSW